MYILVSTIFGSNRNALRALAIALIVNNIPETRKYPEFWL